MPGNQLDPIFKGRRSPTLQQLQSLRVLGGSAALTEKLVNDISYDNVKIIAAGIVTTDQSGAIKSTHWSVMGSVKDTVIQARKIWHQADKDVQVLIRMKDLTLFEFPASTNISGWLDRSDIDIRLIKKSDRSQIDWEAASDKGIGDLSARMIIVPGNPREASLWISVIPLSAEDLASKVGLGNINNPAIPHIVLSLEEAEENAANTFSSGRAVTATLIQQELPTAGLGMGTLAFIDCTSSDREDQGMPDPEKYKEACIKFYRSVHTGAPTTAANFTAAIGKFVDKTASTMKKAPMVYPDYRATATTTGCRFLLTHNRVMPRLGSG